MINVNDEVLHRITGFEGLILEITENNLFIICNEKGEKKIVPEKEIELIRKSEKKITLYTLPDCFSMPK